MKKRYIIAILEVTGDPDDGMQPVKTGCVDGRGVKDVAILNINRCVNLSYDLMVFFNNTLNKWNSLEERELLELVNKVELEID